MASVFTGGKYRVLDASGNPVSNAKVNTYEAATTTPKATYTTRAGDTPNANPVRTNSAGVCSIFLGSGVTRFVVTDANDVALPDGDFEVAAVAESGSLEASSGSASVGFIASGTGAEVRTVQAKLRDFVSVTDFGAVGDGVTDDTAAFLSAATAAASVFVPYTANSYLVSGLDLPSGCKVWGAGTIKTSGGTLIELPEVSLEVNPAEKVMFIESDNQGWEEMLDIKACGYTTVMAYLWHVTLANVIANAEAVGLKVLVHSKFTLANIASWSTLATEAATYDARPSVVGYYVFDEPAGTGISQAQQDTGIDLFRALTKKPLSMAENTVVYSSTGSISDDYDQIFIDVYYPDASSTANDQLAAYIRNAVAFGAAAPRAKLIPLVGLFNDTGFDKSTTLVVQLAAVLAKFSPDGTFGVFCWNAGTAGTYEGTRDTAAYRTEAKRLASSVHQFKPWKIELVPIGTLFTASNKLADVWVNTTEGASPGLTAAPNLVPYYTENTGIASSFREYTFTDNGFMFKGTTGRAGFAGMPAGLCCAYLRWDNREDAGSCTVELGSSATYGHDTTTVVSQVIANGTAQAFYKQLQAGAVFNNMPTIDVTSGSSLSFPFSYLKGYLAFSDVPEVAF